MTPEQEGARCPGCDGPPGPSPMAECIHPWHCDPAPSPHEGEAAREWTLYRFGDDDWHVYADTDEAEFLRESHPGADVVTVRETVPTEPRSISEEQLERQEAIEKARAEGMDDLSFVDPSDLSDDELLAELDASLVGPEGSAFSGDERLTALVRDLMRRVAMNHSTGGGERG